MDRGRDYEIDHFDCVFLKIKLMINNKHGRDLNKWGSIVHVNPVSLSLTLFLLVSYVCHTM